VPTLTTTLVSHWGRRRSASPRARRSDL